MALKIFIVEDESVIREGLRDNIPWEQYGYTFSGEAADGEMALPLIRKIKPDVLITDIKMPFMGGLELSHIVKMELPETRIIIISGYDDFEYAQKAINEGVERYLLKPITRSMLQKALSEIRDKIIAEDEKKKQLLQYQDEMISYEQNKRRSFFEKVFEGQTPLGDLYEDARHLDIDINAPAYNLLFICIEDREGRDLTDDYAGECKEAVLRYLLKYTDRCITFPWTVNTLGVLIKGDEENINLRTEEFLQGLSDIVTVYDKEIEYAIASGESVNRFSAMKHCYRSAYEAFSCRFFESSKHVFRTGDIDSLYEKQEKLESVPEDRGKALSKAIEYIDNHYSNETISLSEVSGAAGVSQSYLSALFGQEKGMTFVEYVTEKRLSKAKELLLTEGIRSGDIGPMVGYKNSQYFATVFKKTEGMSPREWRAANSTNH